MAKEPNSEVEHFFVDCDTRNQDLADEIAGLDTKLAESHSITCFLILPIVTERSKSKFIDSILDFMRSLLLIGDEYIIKALRELRENAAKEKEQSRIDREECKIRKASERKKEKVAKAAI